MNSAGPGEAANGTVRVAGVVDAPSAQRGGHLCWSFRDEDAFRANAVRFLAEGLEFGDRLLYTADRPSTDDLGADIAGLGDVDALVGQGALVLSPLRSLYATGDGFDPARQLARYRELTESSVRLGYRGVRVAAEATALVAAAGRRRFVHYELAIDRLMAQVPMTALCAYDERALGAAVRELCAVHPQRHVGASSDPGFCLYHGRAGLQLTGEVDISNSELFEFALDAVAETAEDDVVLDAGGLAFIDVRGLSQLDSLAGQLAARGHALTVTAPAPIVRRSCAILGLDSLAASMEKRTAWR